MAVFKCKMCGGDLEIIEDSKVAECGYCGTKQTVPSLDNEKKLNLFNRANRLRMNSEFDKAASLYENIIAEFPEEAEAYWGLCLCNYGIEYVDDPATGRKIPTCHRASFEKLQNDENYELAMEYADLSAQVVYRAEAREIDRIMVEILSISKNEEPYDVFICYKETDSRTGERTVDSVLAYDIYEALTARGLKVFFARVTLEEKLGRQYEPYIFAALNSSRVMLSIGTKYEYFNAVWVKNEWSRFLKLMAKDKEKVLIPCFKDMDAYDMPEEFKALQAQDLGKLGAVQDIVRGIEKIIGVTAPQSVNTSNPEGSALTMRGYIYLEDGDFSKADSYFDRALDSNPMDSGAYMGKVLCLLKLSSAAEIDNVFVDLSTFKDFGRACRFAEGEEKALLERIKANADKKCDYKRLSAALNRVARKKVAEEEKIIKEKVAEEERIRREKVAEEERIRREKESEEARIKLASIRKKISKAENLIAAGHKYTVGLKSDGNIVAVGDKFDGRRIVMGWGNIAAIAACDCHTVGLKSDGTVVAVGDNEKGQCNVSEWENIVAVAAGWSHTVGLKSDGTVVAAGNGYDGRCNVSEWGNIAAVTAGWSHTVGLKSDGTVIAVGDNEKGQCNVTEWKNIVAVAAGDFHTVGLKSDGTVVAVGENSYRQCNVTGWKNIVAVAAGERHTVGLKSDGTVVALGENFDRQCKVSDWKNIVAVAAGERHTVGLKSDGTVVAAGNGYDGQCNVSPWKLFDNLDNIEEERKVAKEARIKLASIRKKISKAENLIAAGCNHTVGLKSDGAVVAVGAYFDGQCDVAEWENVVAVSAGGYHTVKLRADGTVVAIGENKKGQCNVIEWEDIVAVTAGWSHTVGLKSDGTVVAVGDNDFKQCNVSEWKNIIAVAVGHGHTVGLKSDGSVVAAGYYKGCDVSEWGNIAAVTAGWSHTVGLRSDGTVIAVGDNEKGQCNVTEWENIVAVAAGYYHTVGLRSDGTVIVSGDNKDGQCNVTEWKNIVAVAAGSGHTVGLKSDGTVVAVGDNACKMCNVSEWKLFDNIDKLDEERKYKTAARAAEEKRISEKKAEYRSKGVCQHCGGTFKGMFTKKCANCGRVKDY